MNVLTYNSATVRMEKNKRQNIIREILKEGSVHSQMELKQELEDRGIEVSQSTISRDLKELGYIRAPVGDGSYRLISVGGGKERLDLLFKLGLIEIDSVDNLVVIKTKPGNAQAVAVAVDRAMIEGIVGTVAGDDTILIITRSKSKAADTIEKLEKYIE